MKITTELLPELTVSRFQRMMEVIELDPPYQREGGIWRPETRSALIDSIINGLDVPKLYFERVTTRRVATGGLAYQYAVIDGKQRLEAIIRFLSEELSLAEDFWYFEDNTVKAGGMTLRDLENQYPLLARRFLDYELSVVSVTTDSGDLIEEMFQRLNASTALNAAERRNALTGPTRDAANTLADHKLLVACSPIRNARYKYRELGAKFLAIEHQIATKSRIVDTKADTLYELFIATRRDPPSIEPAAMESYRLSAAVTLDHMAEVFTENDRLLASIGTVVVYYIVFRDPDVSALIVRSRLERFEALRREVSQIREDDREYSRPANARLREYNVFVQSTNDGRALGRRAQILSAYLLEADDDLALAALDILGDGELPEQDDTEN